MQTSLKLLNTVGKQITLRNVKREKPPRENTANSHRLRSNIQRRLIIQISNRISVNLLPFLLQTQASRLSITDIKKMENTRIT